MKLVFRQKIGIALMVVSAVATVVIQATSRDLLHLTTEAEPPNFAGPHLSSQVFIITIAFTWRYALPLGASAVCGLLLFVIPPRPRRPPP
jgi:hypothetical protein